MNPPEGYYSILALAKMLGHTRETIRNATKNAAFKKAGKAKLYRLDSILASLNNKSDKSLRDQKLVEEIRRLKLANDVKENRLLEKSVYISAHQRILGPLDNLIEQKLVNEYPTAVAGLDVSAARIYGRRIADQLREGFRALLNELPP